MTPLQMLTTLLAKQQQKAHQTVSGTAVLSQGKGVSCQMTPWKQPSGAVLLPVIPQSCILTGSKRSSLTATQFMRSVAQKWQGIDCCTADDI